MNTLWPKGARGSLDCFWVSYSREVKQAMNEYSSDKYRLHLMLCAGTACVSNKSFKIKVALDEELKKQGLDREVIVVMTGCNGFCAVGPVMTVMPDGIFYHTLAAWLCCFLG